MLELFHFRMGMEHTKTMTLEDWLILLGLGLMSFAGYFMGVGVFVHAFLYGWYDPQHRFVSETYMPALHLTLLGLFLLLGHSKIPKVLERANKEKTST